MKNIFLYGLAIGAATIAGSASAQVTGSLLASSSGPFLTLSTAGLSAGAVATLTGGIVYSSDQPFADQPAGSIFGGRFLAAGPTSGNTATLTFTTPVSYLSFLWGSPDTYNTLTVTTTGVAGSQTFTAASLGFPVTNGNQMVSQYVQFQELAGKTIASVSFSNVPSVDAFETANFSITAVPEPATWAMMILGFGLVGYGMRRVNATVARFA